MGLGRAGSVVPYPTPAAIRICSGADHLLPLSLHLQASEPEQTTSDPDCAAAAPVWDLICSIFEPVQQKPAKHAQSSSGTPTRTHSLLGTLLGASTPPYSPTPCCADGLALPACVVDVRPQANLRALQFSWLMLSLRLGL